MQPRTGETGYDSAEVMGQGGHRIEMPEPPESVKSMLDKTHTAVSQDLDWPNQRQ